MPSDVPLNKEDYALLIGIDQYLWLDPLKGAQKDVALFQEWLMDPKGGAVPVGNIHVVLSPPTPDPDDPQPIRDKVNLKLTKMGVMRGRRIGRRLYFYFSGHGYGKIDDVGMLMGNASLGELKNNLACAVTGIFFLNGAFLMR